MKRFKEKRIVDIFNGTGLIMTACLVISIVLFTIYTNLYFLVGWFFLGSLFFFTLGYLFSRINRYSKEFISYMRNKLKTATTLEDFIALENEFNALALTNGYCFLSYPKTIKEIGTEIYNKVDILIKVNDKSQHYEKHYGMYKRLSETNGKTIETLIGIRNQNILKIEEMREALEEAKKELEYHNWANTRTYFKIVEALNLHNEIIEGEDYIYTGHEKDMTNGKVYTISKVTDDCIELCDDYSIDGKPNHQFLPSEYSDFKWVIKN